MDNKSVKLNILSNFLLLVNISKIKMIKSKNFTDFYKIIYLNLNISNFRKASNIFSGLIHKITKSFIL